MPENTPKGKHRLFHIWGPAALGALATIIAAVIGVTAATKIGVVYIGAGPQPTITATVTTAPIAEDAASPSTSEPTDKPAGGQWYFLSDLDPIDTSTGTNCTGGCTGEKAASTTVGGTVYAQSRVIGIAASGAESITTWNASNHCTRLEATVGLTDDSPTTTAQFQAVLDGGSPVDLATVTTGHGSPISIDLADVFRFQLEAHLTKALPFGTSGQHIAWGNARVLCTATP